MTIQTFRIWFLPVVDLPGHYIDVPAGEYEVSRIDNPRGFSGKWLQLRGTGAGASELFLRGWKNGEVVDNPGHEMHGKPVDWKEFEIIIKE